MKRINPQTNQPFKSGDVRDDGMVFRCYNTKRVRKDGTFTECWLLPESYTMVKHRMKVRARRRRDAAFYNVKSGT